MIVSCSVSMSSWLACIADRVQNIVSNLCEIWKIIKLMRDGSYSTCHDSKLIHENTALVNKSHKSVKLINF